MSHVPAFVAAALRRAFSHASRSRRTNAMWLRCPDLTAWMALDGNPQQGQVPDEIEQLVSHALVGKARRLGAHHRVAVVDERRLQRAAADHAQLAQPVDVLAQDERPRRGDLLLVDLGREHHRAMLRPDGGVGVVDREAQAQPVAGNGDDLHVTIGVRHRAVDAVDLDRVSLVDLARLAQERDVVSVSARRGFRRFGSIERDDDVVDLERTQRRQHVLHRVDTHVVRVERRVAHRLGIRGDTRHVRDDLHGRVEVDTHEADARVGFRRAQRHRDVLARVQPATREGHFTGDGLLLTNHATFSP